MSLEREIDPANPFDYPQPIWSRFEHCLGEAVERAGRFAAGTPGVAEGRAGTPAARSVLELQLRFDGERVADARFRAYGCPSSIAVGAWIADWSIGRSASELAGLNARRLREVLEIPEDRAHCALMGEDAIKALLARRSQSSTET